ncbi:hypothetical protein [Aneurinibacillus uraniidurans]|uniref:hypothetical protein n=1 Tax=Aneurinibacillus uraniidurans TaxID=2966586 RepID=UPI00234ABB50|nr:hypothetical protein [Aneurinibacillus sp. B1]WCN38486.1 hypothetical protein PO771_03565 [Aneurinibacillus sp. B1]
MRKPSFYTWMTTRAVDGMVDLLRVVAERVGQRSLLSRLKARWDARTWQYALWTLFIMVFLHVYILLFIQKLVLIVALDVAVAILLIAFGPERIWTMLRTSIPGRLAAHLFDPNK